MAKRSLSRQTAFGTAENNGATWLSLHVGSPILNRLLQYVMGAPA